MKRVTTLPLNPEKIFTGSPGPYDVLCGRDKDAFNSTGNRRFRLTIGLHFRPYMNASSRKKRSEVIVHVTDTILKKIGYRFLVPIDKGCYMELEERRVRAKVGHALRDMAMYHRCGCQKQSQRGNNEATDVREGKI